MTQRLFVVTKSLDLGGTEIATGELLSRLDRRLVEPIFMCFSTSVFIRRLLQRFNLDIAIVEGTNESNAWALWLGFRKLQPDVVLFVHAELGIISWWVHFAARLSGARRVVAIEHLLADPPPPGVTGHGLKSLIRRWLGWRTRYMLGIRLRGALCHKTICVSTGVRNRLVHDYQYSKKNTVVILNGIDVQRFRVGGESFHIREALKIGREEIVLVAVARLEPRKRIDILLKALALVLNKSLPCKCIIVGDGPSKNELVNLASQLGVGSAVHFVGYQQDVSSYLRESDIYVTPSEKEGSPLTLLEAMATGLPCIATDIDGHNEVVEHGSSGLLCALHSAESVARCLEELLADSQKRRLMASRSRQRAESHFDIEATTARLKHVLFEEPYETDEAR